MQDDIGVPGDRPGTIALSIHNGGGQFIGEGTGKFSHSGIDRGTIGGHSLASLVHHLSSRHTIGKGVGEFNLTDGVGVGDDLRSHTGITLTAQTIGPLNGLGATSSPICAEGGESLGEDLSCA